MLKKLVNECKINITIATEGPLLIKSGYSTPFGSDMTPVVTYKNGQPQVYIPGSSIKGVFRSHMEMISRSINDLAVCDPFFTYEKENPSAGNKWNDETYRSVFCGEKFKALKNIWQEQASNILNNKFTYRNSCLACRLFGSTFYTGRLFFNDAYLKDPGISGNPVERRDCVGLDRFSGGVISGPFDLEAIRSGVEFETELYLRNYEAWQLGALLMIIKDLKDGFIRFGMGSSRGLGKVSGRVNRFWLAYLEPLVKDMNHNEIWGLGKFLVNGEYGTNAEDIIKIEEDLPYQSIGLRKEFFVETQQESEENDALSDNDGLNSIVSSLENPAIKVYVDEIQSQEAKEQMSYSYLNEQGTA